VDQELREAWPACACLALSAALIFLAPAWMPSGYSAWTHSVSESAAQGVPHAAWARCGLALMGLGAALAGLWGPHRQGPLTACLLLFGMAMVASALWSHRPWWPEAPFAPFDARADRLHSIAAQAAGVSFLAAVGLRAARHWTQRRRIDLLDTCAAGAAMLAPLAMLLDLPGRGAAQRVMFGLAYVWLARQARPGGPGR
jgi:hypothetical protein